MKKKKDKKSIKQNLRNQMINLKYKFMIKNLLKTLKTKELIIDSFVISNKLKTLTTLIKYLDKSLKKRVFHKNAILRKKKLAYAIFNDFLKKTKQ